VHLVVQPQQPLPELDANARVERAERLVQEQHLWKDVTAVPLDAAFDAFWA
jgi:hypothetical protein